MATRRVLLALPNVTAEEVQAAKAACANYRRLCCAVERAEKAREAALAQIFLRIGFTLEEVKAMNPERLAAEIQRRAGIAFSFDSPEACNFAILKISADRSPAWKDHFMARMGPAITSEVELSTRVQFTYDIVDRPRAEQARPDVIYLPKRAGKEVGKA